MYHELIHLGYKGESWTGISSDAYGKPYGQAFRGKGKAQVLQGMRGKSGMTTRNYRHSTFPLYWKFVRIIYKKQTGATTAACRHLL